MTVLSAPELETLLPDFEARLRSALRSDVEFIQVIGEDLARAGGKRVRPLLSALAGTALGLGEDELTDLAVAVELLHSASLLHDDLIDDADTRRGQAAAFRRFGNVVSVMSGDYMLSRVLILLSRYPQALTRHFGEAASALCEGEVLQFQVAACGEYSLANYERIIYGKTAALTELAARAPALLRHPEHEAALATFGREYGLAFQMRDDLLDLCGSEEALGKPVGSDLRDGKATLPLLLLPPGAWETARAVLERRAEESGDVAVVRELVREHSLVPSLRAVAAHRDHAVAALESLPPGPAREGLRELALRSLRCPIPGG